MKCTVEKKNRSNILSPLPPISPLLMSFIRLVSISTLVSCKGNQLLRCSSFKPSTTLLVGFYLLNFKCFAFSGEKDARKWKNTHTFIFFIPNKCFKTYFFLLTKCNEKCIKISCDVLFSGSEPIKSKLNKLRIWA